MLAAVGPGALASPFPRRAGELVPSRENLWASRVTLEPPELVQSASASLQRWFETSVRAGQLGAERCQQKPTGRVVLAELGLRSPG